jgi:hypothetical protein
MDVLDIGLIVLCPDRNIGGLRNTAGSVLFHFYDRECIAVAGDDVTKEELVQMEKHCVKAYKGKNTITSLVNKGMRHLKHKWGFIVFAGSRVQPFMERKLADFVASDTDILYPLVEGKYNFVEGSFNGVLINKKFFNKVGKFPEDDLQKQGVNDFELAKLLWSIEAIEQGATFKGICGLRVI